MDQEMSQNQEQAQVQNQILSGQRQKLSKRERKALKRQEKEVFRQKEKRTKTVRGMGVAFLGIFALIGVGLGIFVLIVNSGPRDDDLSVLYPSQGRQHIAVGSLHPEYNSNPPTSGWHYPNPPIATFYDNELEDEQVMHNLEHGDVWITYLTSISNEAKKQLKKLAGSKVIVTPRSKNDTDIAIVAWTRGDKFDIGENGLDTQRLKDFISRYRNRGPERVAPVGGHGGIGTN